MPAASIVSAPAGAGAVSAGQFAEVRVHGDHVAAGDEEIIHASS
jgi:hypothetical protein